MPFEYDSTGEFDHQQFLVEVTRPRYGDRMVFQISRPLNDIEPERTFSGEAVETVMDNIRTFVMGRILTRNRTVGGPKHLRLQVSLTWEEDPSLAAGLSPIPYWYGQDLGDKGQPFEEVIREALGL